MNSQILDPFHGLPQEIDYDHHLTTEFPTDSLILEEETDSYLIDNHDHVLLVSYGITIGLISATIYQFLSLFDWIRRSKPNFLYLPRAFGKWFGGICFLTRFLLMPFRTTRGWHMLEQVYNRKRLRPLPPAQMIRIVSHFACCSCHQQNHSQLQPRQPVKRPSTCPCWCDQCVFVSMRKLSIVHHHPQLLRTKQCASETCDQAVQTNSPVRSPDSFRKITTIASVPAILVPEDENKVSSTTTKKYAVSSYNLSHSHEESINFISGSSSEDESAEASTRLIAVDDHYEYDEENQDLILSPVPGSRSCSIQADSKVAVRMRPRARHHIPVVRSCCEYSLLKMGDVERASTPVLIKPRRVRSTRKSRGPHSMGKASRQRKGVVDSYRKLSLLTSSLTSDLENASQTMLSLRSQLAANDLELHNAETSMELAWDVMLDSNSSSAVPADAMSVDSPAAVACCSCNCHMDELMNRSVASLSLKEQAFGQQRKPSSIPLSPSGFLHFSLDEDCYEGKFCHSNKPVLADVQTTQIGTEDVYTLKSYSEYTLESDKSTSCSSLSTHHSQIGAELSSISEDKNTSSN